MELNTAEKFLLLAKHPEKYWFKIPALKLKFGIIGAALLDLSLRKILDIQDNRFQINEKSDYIDKEYPAYEQISEQIIHSKRTRKPRYWIQKFARKSRRYKWEFLYGLEKKRLLRIEKRKFLVIPYRRCYLLDNRTRNQLISNLREIVLYKKKKSEEDIAILGMIKACKMFKIISKDWREKIKIKKEIKEVLKDSPISQTVENTIKQVQIAIAIAMSASTAGR